MGLRCGPLPVADLTEGLRVVDDLVEDKRRGSTFSVRMEGCLTGGGLLVEGCL